MTNHTCVSGKNQTSFLLLSGGIGSRSGYEVPKQFVILNNQPVISYSLVAADNAPEISEIIVNSPDGYHDKTVALLDKYVKKTPARVVSAGHDRQESTHILCLEAKYDTVILHEAARPIISPKTIQNLLNHPKPNVGYCAPINFSMCKVDYETGKITGSVKRSDTQNIQLPQKFDQQTLLEAHRKAINTTERFTEDALLCLSVLGTDVYFCEGEPTNIKITTPADFVIVLDFLPTNKPFLD